MSIRKDVTSRTIATVIAAPIIGLLWWFWEYVRPVIGAIFSWIGSMFVWSWGMVTSIFAWLTGNVVLQRWWFFLLLGAFSWFVWRTLRPVIKRIRNPTPPDPTYLDFTQLSHVGIVWRWEWKRGLPEDVSGYCPQCDRRIRYTEDPMRFDRFHPTVLFCTNCPSTKVEVERRFDDILNDVRLEIDHAIRTETWKQLVRQHPVK